MENQIYYISKIEYERLSFNATDNLFIISGAECLCLNDYLNQVYEKLSFPPIDVRQSLDSYFDWIRDLQWLSRDEIIFVITDFDMFLVNDSVHKRIIIDLFKNEILPWWEYEVKNHVVDGTTRKFNVYLVSNN